MSGIGVILNPYSRSNRKNPKRAERLGFIVGDKGSCHATTSMRDVELLAQEFKARAIEVLAISGGDGTYHHTLTMFAHVYGDTPLPKIAFLRGGTMNIVANDLKIQGTPEALLSQLIYRYHQEENFHTVALPMLKVKDRLGFLFGNGVMYRVIQEYYRITNNQPSFWDGVRLMGLGVVHSLLQTRWIGKMSERFDARVLLDGKPWPFKNYTCIFGGTITNTGFGFCPLYRARQNLNQFQLIGFSVPPRSLIWNFPGLILGKKNHSEHFLDGVASKVDFEFSAPEPYMLDGELCDPVTHLMLEQGPVLQVIV